MSIETSAREHGGTGETGSVPPLRGSRCTNCGNVAFPVAVGCQRCGSGALTPLELSRDGVVWAHTVQRFAPKSPPYVPPADGFRPFAVGYVELSEGVRVEAVLESVDHPDYDALTAAEVTLVGIQPVPRFATSAWLDAHPEASVDAPIDERSGR